MSFLVLGESQAQGCGLLKLPGRATDHADNTLYIIVIIIVKYRFSARLTSSSWSNALNTSYGRQDNKSMTNHDRRQFMRMTFGSETTSPPGPTNVVWKFNTMSMKNMTSTMESTTNSDTSSLVLFLNATLYGTIMAVQNVRHRMTQSHMALNAQQCSRMCGGVFGASCLYWGITSAFKLIICTRPMYTRIFRRLRRRRVPSLPSLVP